MNINLRKSENLIYLLIWLIVLALPIFTLKGGNEFNWDRVLSEWFRLLPFMLIFFLNNSLFAPKLLLQKKLIWYFIAILVLTIVFSFLNDLPRWLHDILFQMDLNPERPHQPMHHPFPMDPMPPIEHNRPGVRPLNNKPFSYLIIENVIISFLVVGFNNAIKLGIRQQTEEFQREETEKIHLETELSFLRQQISPHFFMNTLNNIHALIELDQTQAQKSVIELSKLMRYLLKESQRGEATLKEEFEFLKSYIDLMSIRYSNRVKINVNLHFINDQIKIPALLFISLVENAFKYGISYTQECYVFISAIQSNQSLKFEIKNSKPAKTKNKPSTGLGLTNLEKQLNLLFGDDFSLNRLETDKEYHVTLIIPLLND